MMETLVHPLAEAYAARYSSAPSALLQELQAFTETHHPKHHMISGQVQGRFLSFLSQIIQPRYILELGTFTGYSALCLAEGLLPGGQLHTIEARAEDAAVALSFFKRSVWASQLILHTGQASEILPTLPHTWDLVFIDADKTSLSDYYEMLIPRLQPGGLLVVDNLLFHGQVLQTPLKGKNAQALNAFAEQVASDQRTQQVLLTVRDGLLLIKKLR